MQPSDGNGVEVQEPAAPPKVGKGLARFHARGLFGPAARVGWNGATGLYEIKLRLRGRAKAYRTIGTGPSYRDALLAAIQASQPNPEGVAR